MCIAMLAQRKMYAHVTLCATWLRACATHANALGAPTRTSCQHDLRQHVQHAHQRIITPRVCTLAASLPRPMPAQPCAGEKRVAHKTMDGSEVAPKWGIYNKEGVGHDMHVDLRDLCLGRSLAAVQSALPQE